LAGREGTSDGDKSSDEKEEVVEMHDGRGEGGGGSFLPFARTERRWAFLSGQRDLRKHVQRIAYRVPGVSHSTCVPGNGLSRYNKLT